VAANSTQNLGSVAVGGALTGTLTPTPCPFLPGVTVNIAVNGVAVGTKTANASGGVPVNLQVTSATSGLLNDPVTVAIHCGENTIPATGLTTGGVATVTGVFNVVCGVAPSAAAGAAAAPSAA